MPKLTSHLSIRNLELSINLGWRHKERQHEQSVLLDVDIYFAKPPKATQTDQLKDTLCYATLIEAIHENLGEKKYKLIEHLSYDIYHIIKKCLPIPAKIMIHLTKYPQIKGLPGGVCFHYGDER